MVRYPRPVMHNGKLVLWHGVWRGRGSAPREAHAAAPAQPADAASTQATPGAPRAFSILVDSADPAAARMAGEWASAVSGDDATVKVVQSRTSRAALV